MELNIEVLINAIDWIYSMAVVLSTYLILSYVFIRPSKVTKIIVTLLIGLILGAIWYLVNNTPITNLIISFLITPFIYNWVIKLVLDKFNATSDYNNKKGII